MARARSLASYLGAFAGLGGASHGIGEMLQGSVDPGVLIFPAWPSLAVLNGEPAMSILPNLLMTGALAIAIGLAAAFWSWQHLHGPHGGAIMIMLSAALLLLGGGLFPPVFGMMAGIAATAWAGDLAARRGRKTLAAVLALFLVAATATIFTTVGVLV